jgi:hypothetical protein
MDPQGRPASGHRTFSNGEHQDDEVATAAHHFAQRMDPEKGRFLPIQINKLLADMKGVPVLHEIGFMTHPQDLQKMLDKETQKAMGTRFVESYQAMYEELRQTKRFSHWKPFSPSGSQTEIASLNVPATAGVAVDTAQSTIDAQRVKPETPVTISEQNEVFSWGELASQIMKVILPDEAKDVKPSFNLGK